VSDLPKKESSLTLKEIGGFELIGKIGQGGMGTVFKARQKSLDRIVALKVLPPSVAKDAKFIERFQREARACAKLNHPNIVQGVDVGKDPATGVWYFAMELVDGPSVLKLLKEERVLPEERALQIARDIARALECAATHGIVHRDIKPDNILLTARGDAKLADLGLAKQLNDDASLTQSGQAVGTPYYMAPEQVRGRSDQLDIRTDIYALGGTLFHLVTGQPPFTGETSAVIMSKHLTEAVPKAMKVNRDVSEGCSRMIEQMMQKDRENRIQTPSELITQIERVLRGETVTRPLTQTISATRRKKDVVEKPASRMPLVLAGVAIALIAAVVLMSRPKEEPAARKVEPEPKPVAVTQPTPKPRETPKEVARPKTPAPLPAVAPAPVEPPVVEVTPVSQPASVSPVAPVVPAALTSPTIEKHGPEKTEKPIVAAVPVTPAPAAPATPATPRAEWPLADILAAVRENAPKKALEKIQDGNYAGKDSMLDALKLLETQRETRFAAIGNLVGQMVKLDTAKGPQNGKLVAFKNGTLHLERAIMINGEARGTSQAAVAVEDLLPATLARLSPTPAPAAPADWIAAALTSMAVNQMDTAEAALKNLTGNELADVLAAELKQTRIRDREAQAQAAWAKIETRAAEAPSQTRAKQLTDEINAFSKKFADSDFAASPEIAAKMVELKEKFERLALGLDPRVLKLFKGKVLSYDPRTQIITLGYDLLTKEQTEDFIDSLWAPPGDTTGLTWKKGELKTFCKGTADRVFKMPQFLSNSLNIQLSFKKVDTSKRNRFEVEVSLHGLESTGKTPKVSFRASEKGSHFLNGGAELKANLDEVPFRNDGMLEVSCQGQLFVAKENGKVILEHTQTKPNDHAGFWIGGGWDSGITFTKLQISGRLDPAWLAKALEAVTPKPR